MEKQDTPTTVGVQEIIYLSEEKQKELYEIVQAAFSEDLKSKNCFILPEVGKRIGEELVARGFGKANKQTFLSAPNYFRVGYNEKNAASISLIGFEDDSNFSLTKIDREELTKKTQKTVSQNTEVFDDARQEELSKIIETTYAKYLQKRNCILLSDIAKRLGGLLIKRNFGKASKQMFARAPQYFACGYNEKNGACIMLLTHPVDPNFSDSPKITIVTYPKTVSDFIDRLYANLKKLYKTLDVSEAAIQKYFVQNKLVLPREIEDFNKLFDILSEKFGCVVRSNGENMPEERFLVLRKTLPIPQATVDTIKKIVEQYFADKEIVSNTDIGQALVNNGVNYKEFNYPDLTGFLRSFTELFSIVPITDPKTKRVQINVRILKDSLTQIMTDKNNSFKEKLQQVINEGKYEHAIEPAVLRTALDINDAEIWEIIIHALAQAEQLKVSPVVSVTEWEKLVITMSNRVHTVLDDVDFMIHNGIDEQQRLAVRSFLTGNTSKTWNFSSIGLRIAAMCGEENSLAAYFYFMGLIAGDSADRNYSFRNYAIFCAKYYPELFRHVWDQYKDTHVVNSSMLYIIGTLFTAKCYELLIYAYENMPSKISRTDQLGIYYIYAKAIYMTIPVAELPALNILDETRGAEVLISYLDSLDQRNNLTEYCDMLYLCITEPEQYISRASMDYYLSKNSRLIARHFDELIELVKCGEYKYWFITNYFVTHEYVQDQNNVWSNYSRKYKESLKERIVCAASDEERQSLIRTAMLYFPNDKEFDEDSIEVIKSSILGASTDKIKEICAHLFSVSNYTVFINIYEENLISHDEPWFLGYVSQSYFAQGDIEKAVNIKVHEVMVQKELRINPEQSITQLICIIYESVVAGKLLDISKQDACLILELIQDFQPAHSELYQFHFSVMELAIIAEKVGLYSILYTLVDEINKEKHELYLQNVERAIMDCDEGYMFRIGDFVKTYEYILTTENVETITAYSKILANILKYDGFERDYQKYRSTVANEIDSTAITKLFIVDFEEEKSWRLLSKYSNDCGKYSLNYTANLLWLLKFNEKGHPLTNCTRALNQWVDDSLPKNYLINNAYLLRSRLRIDGYWQSFYQHIVKYNSFAEAADATVDAYLDVLTTKKRTGAYECSLIISILSQISNPSKYYHTLLDESSTFVSGLLANTNCLVRFLALLACEREEILDCSESIDFLRNKVNSEHLSEKERSAIRWVNALFDLRNEGKYDESFFETSKVILANYPSEPANNIISEKVLIKSPDSHINYNLITYWINTFDNFRIVSYAYNYLLRRKRPDNATERLDVYRLQASILRKLIIYYDGDENKRIPDYLRVCKAYLAIKILSNDHSTESDAFKRKMHGGLKNKREINALKSYEGALTELLSADVSPFIREELLYCGITNYWDTFLWELLERTDELQKSVDTILSYIDVLDRRPMRRRLLQMYLYVSIANLQALGISSEKIATIRIKEVLAYKSDIETGSLITEQYFSNLQTLTNLLCPPIGDLINKVSAVNDAVKKSECLSILYFVLINKKWNDLAAKLLSEKFEWIDELLVPCVSIIQNPKEISQIVEYLAYAPNDIVRNFLANKEISEVLGGFFTNYYYAVYETKCKQYETAQNYLNVAGECPHYMTEQYEKLSKAIVNREDVENSKAVQDKGKTEEIPQLSFMCSKDPEGLPLSQLVMEFYSESGLHDASTKCLIAQRIYYYLLEGSTVRDIYNFMYHWGFYAVDCEYDIERKANILFELLDNVHKLEDNTIFKDQFTQQFVYILNEYEFNIFVKNFSEILEHYKRLFAEFRPFDDCFCYAELMVHLSKLTALTSDNIDTNKAVSQIEEIQKSILAVHAQYPQNYFSRKCIEFVDQFKYQLFERGVFEVRILNENSLYNGIVYYQIKNIGFETIPEISLTLYLDGIDGTIRLVKISDEVPGGLRPNQVYAGEYAPNVDIAEGQEVICILQLEYGDKNYIAVDASSGGKLISKPDEYEYHKSSFSGYLESTIDSDDQKNFIGRQSEIEEIMGSIVKRQNVLLFGTNGTGKSSILNCLSSVYIPNLCKSMEKIAVTINIVSDDGCTEAQVVNGLLDRICSENCMLLREIRKIERRYPDIDFTDTYEYLNDAIIRRNQLIIVDENGVNSSNIIELFTSISSALKCAGLKLFLLWDNFERVISSPNVNPKHMSFLRTLRETPNAMSNVLFVFSGSNYLLEAVSIKQGSDSWNEILTRCATRIKIGNLCYEDFYALMSQKRALNNGEIHYSPEAIEYLWKYTNGHAFYSCLLGNRTLEILSSRKVRRRCIYPSDIFAAIYKSDKHVHTDGSDTSKETAIEKQIFQDISNNIAVKYVGRKLAEYIAQGATKVSHVKLQDVVLRTRPDISESSFDAALDILRARDFIRKISASPSEQDEDYSSSWFEYSFTSDLYLERFVSIYVPELTQKATEDIEKKKKDIYDMLRDATVEDIERLKRLMGTNISGGSVTSTTFESGSTQTNTNIQVNVQSITNTLNDIITAGDNTAQILNGLRDLPRLSNYLPQLTAGEDSLPVSEERLSIAMDSYVADMEEGIEASFEQAGTQVSSLTPYWDILGMKRSKYMQFMEEYDVPEFFLHSLRFAYQLDQLFEQGAVSEEAENIDYSPVTIMYCKLVESMLKEYHIKAYSKCFSKEESDLKRNKFKKYTWGEIISLPQQQKQRLTIGSFVFPLDNVPGAVAQLAATTYQEEEMWQAHKVAIKAVKDIRNPSAHGNKDHRITATQKNTITRLLLEEGGLVRLLRIVR